MLARRATDRPALLAHELPSCQHWPFSGSFLSPPENKTAALLNRRGGLCILKGPWNDPSACGVLSNPDPAGGPSRRVA